MIEASIRPQLFFDSTEIVRNRNSSSPGLGGIASPHLCEAARQLQAGLYVPELVIEEVLQQRLQAFSGQAAAIEDLRHYLPVGDVPANAALSEKIRADLRAALTELSVTFVPTDSDLTEILPLALEQAGPLKGKRLPGFLDVVILLSCAKYAHRQGFRDCWFVTSDSGFDLEGVRRVTRPHGVTFKLMVGAEKAAKQLQELLNLHLKSLEETRARQALEYLSANLETINDFLAYQPLPESEFFHSLVEEPVAVRRTVINEIDRAVPRDEMVDGEICRLAFYASAESVVTMRSKGIRISTDYATGSFALVTGRDRSEVGTPFQEMGGPVDRIVTIGVIGEAEVRVEGQAFVGTPRVKYIARDRS